MLTDGRSNIHISISVRDHVYKNNFQNAIKIIATNIQQPHTAILKMLKYLNRSHLFHFNFNKRYLDILFNT